YCLSLSFRCLFCFFFFCHVPAPTEIYTLSLHDALPICRGRGNARAGGRAGLGGLPPRRHAAGGRPHDRAWRSRRCRGGTPRRTGDRKSTRLNSSHGSISYAVFCLKKKNKTTRRSNLKTH